jgi:hypothetical protein
MRLLATSTPQQRNTVRILFYGKSLAEQGWAKLVEDDLRRRFPHANLIVENRALGGFASQMLVKTAETDLYPFQPDLLIFHVYGAHDSYEDIIRRTRERTTAEILMQNDHGEWLMAECVKAYLRYDPHLGPSPAEDWVKTLDVGKEVKWADGTLQCEFTGRRVDAICGTSDAAPAAIRIDGRKPSERAELYGFTRAVTEPQGKWLVKWPVIAPIGSQVPLLVEDWTLAVTRDSTVEQRFTFTLTGSKTGPDGAGRSDERFVSQSGRVVLEANNWNVAYALGVLGGINPVPDEFDVKWCVEPHFVDEFIFSDASDPAAETTVTLAEGLPNARHTPELSGSEETPITALRVYRPPLREEPTTRSQ